jgi:hypothetical protein
MSFEAPRVVRSSRLRVLRTTFASGTAGVGRLPWEVGGVGEPGPGE